MSGQHYFVSPRIISRSKTGGILKHFPLWFNSLLFAIKFATDFNIEIAQEVAHFQHYTNNCTCLASYTDH